MNGKLTRKVAVLALLASLSACREVRRSAAMAPASTKRTSTTPSWVKQPNDTAPVVWPARATTEGFPDFARIHRRSQPIYAARGRRRLEIGALRLGAAVRVRGAADITRGCRGRWLALEPMGFICKDRHVVVAKRPPALKQVLLPVDRDKDVPFAYVKVTSRKAYRYGRIPSDAARKALLAGDKDPDDLDARPLRGTYFLAITKPLSEAKPWAETLEGNFVHKDMLAPIEGSSLRGAHLGKRYMLPLVFVNQAKAPVYRRSAKGKLKRVFDAERYARVALASNPPEGAPHVETKDGHWLRRDHVRLVRQVARPEGVPEGARWIDIHLAEQTLTLYENGKPVYATLISSGLEGHDTPTGLFQLTYKHLSTTMRGEDEAGPYEVQEVPWAMFYDPPYAVHGAYWHDNFGNRQSHGCTNVAPKDARWLFARTAPEVHDGWHLAIGDGTWVRFR